MWFWKKEEEPEENKIPRKLMVKDTDKPLLLELNDAVINGKSNTLARYRFWKYAEDNYPETKDGAWTFNTKSAIEPYFLELLKG